MSSEPAKSKAAFLELAQLHHDKHPAVGYEALLVPLYVEDSIWLTYSEEFLCPGKRKQKEKAELGQEHF